MLRALPMANKCYCVDTGQAYQCFLWQEVCKNGGYLGKML